MSLMEIYLIKLLLFIRFIFDKLHFLWKFSISSRIASANYEPGQNMAMLIHLWLLSHENGRVE